MYAFVVDQSNAETQIPRLREVGTSARTGNCEFGAAWDLMLLAMDQQIKAGWLNSKGSRIKRFDMKVEMRRAAGEWHISATMRPVLQ